MWIIIANKGILENRENRISELFGEILDNRYLSLKNGIKSYNITPSLQYSKIFKRESDAIRIVNSFNSLDLISKKQTKFKYISEYVLTIRKLTKDEWDNIVDFEISKLEFEYQKEKTQLLNKKTQWK